MIKSKIIALIRCCRINKQALQNPRVSKISRKSTKNYCWLDVHETSLRFSTQLISQTLRNRMKSVSYRKKENEMKKTWNTKMIILFLIKN